LIADKLTFAHPINGDKLKFEIDLPVRFKNAFEILEQCEVIITSGNNSD